MSNKSALLPISTENKSSFYSTHFNRISRLYRGYLPLCVAESLSNIAAFLLNDELAQHGYSPLATSTIAGAIAAPICAVGEDVMVNRQVNNRSLWQCVRTSWKASGLVATILRDTPFIIAVLGAAPIIERAIPVSNDMIQQISGGILAGAFAGAVTTPVDTIKTNVQAKNITILKASNLYFNSVTTREGLFRLVKVMGIRTSYIGLTVGIMNVFINQFRNSFPHQLKRD